ncbi:MAG: hypothetical protein N2322_00920, partial [Terrimicrobiaceae bacterium]|nr:hypothetical protein [Terrimicrobiaceae bacterium]
FTVWLGVGFFVVTLLLAMAYAHNQPSGSKLERELLNSQVPATTAPAAVSEKASTAQPSGSAIQNESGEAAIPEKVPAGVDAPAVARPEPQPSPASP